MPTVGICMREWQGVNFRRPTCARRLCPSRRRHPELSYHEVKTAAWIVEQLRSYGVEEIHTGIARTGVVAVVRGQSDHPCLALRADMDALPLEETGDLEFKSTNKGVMHACGHDGHMSILLAAVKAMVAKRAEMKGTLVAIFQPAEEGYAGAQLMVEEGVLGGDVAGPSVDCIMGLHLWNYDPVGRVSTRVGGVMANSDRFRIRVKGSGGHGAAPHGTVDAVLVAANVIMALQSIVSRNVSPTQSAVISCGIVQGGYAFNIIADEVEILGTCRTYDTKVQAMVADRIKSVAAGVAAAYGAGIDYDYWLGYPATVNVDATAVGNVLAAAEKVVGPDGAGEPTLTMAGEDFSYFLHKVPGCFFFVGSAPEGVPVGSIPHHKSVFTFSEDCLLVGASVMLQVAEDMLVTQTAAFPEPLAQPIESLKTDMASAPVKGTAEWEAAQKS